MSDLYVSVIEPYIFQSKLQTYEIYNKYSNSFFASKYTYAYSIKLNDVREYTAAKVSDCFQIWSI